MAIKQRIGWLILHLLWVVPIKRRRVAFLCYNCTQYSCNPKYIGEYLNSEFPDEFEMIWFFSSRELKEKIPEFYKKYKKNSLRYFFNLITAEVVISNVTLPRVVPFRKRQKKINTWHGTAFKGDSNLHKNNYNRFDYFLAENQLTYEVFRRKDSFNYQGNIVKIGMPRNDMLIKGDSSIREKVFDTLNIPKETKVVLYAPTYRDSQEKDCFDINFDILINSLMCKFPSNWIILFRYHHMQENKIFFLNGIDVTTYPDMQELLLSSDVLVTDYSSSMWDFSLMGKIVLLYASDTDRYIRDERGDFYYPLVNLPFPIANNNEELEQRVRALDIKKYIYEVKMYHQELGRFNYQGDATAKFVDYFLKNKEKKGFSV